ncbi:hypothetical protein [Metabacillus schmidteae]|uniref:hypothetical protein n=1 Tax=Metabacillus schmidteae TaxID=2730405 RepID=UPI00158E5FF2|nr:hypothetical protein [Metabacillus schmidteae]
MNIYLINNCREKQIEMILSEDFIYDYFILSPITAIYLRFSQFIDYSTKIYNKPLALY